MLTNSATHLCKCNGVADLVKTPPRHTCYHAEFGRSRPNRVDLSSGNPKNWVHYGNAALGGMA